MWSATSLEEQDGERREHETRRERVREEQGRERHQERAEPHRDRCDVPNPVDRLGNPADEQDEHGGRKHGADETERPEHLRRVADRPRARGLECQERRKCQACEAGCLVRVEVIANASDVLGAEIADLAQRLVYDGRVGRRAP